MKHPKNPWLKSYLFFVVSDDFEEKYVFVFKTDNKYVICWWYSRALKVLNTSRDLLERYIPTACMHTYHSKD